MTVAAQRTHTVKAKIVHGQKEAPVQVELSRDAALGLALIAENFAKEIEPNSDEVRQLISLAETISIRLMDLSAAMSVGGTYQHPELELAS